MGTTLKPFITYLTTPSRQIGNAIADYASSPASSFLAEVVHLSDAVNNCIRHFPKKQGGNYTKDSEDSLFRLSACTLAGVMGHLETFERFFFAGLIELSRLVPTFGMNRYCSKLSKKSGIEISLAVATSYRGQPAPIGQLLAESLGGWHDPKKVNDYLRRLVESPVDFFSDADIRDLRTLWQLRHSIVHTAGWITQPDSQKVAELQQFGGRHILVEPRFIESVARRLHPMLQAAVSRLESGFRTGLPGGHSRTDSRTINSLFRVESPRDCWFQQGK